MMTPDEIAAAMAHGQQILQEFNAALERFREAGSMSRLSNTELDALFYGSALWTKVFFGEMQRRGPSLRPN